MKILIVSSYLPYPLNSGGHIRLFNLIKELSKKHEITLISEKRSWQKEEDIKKVSEITKKVITVDRKKQWSPKNILKSGFSSKSFLITGHTSETMKAVIKEELENNKFDLIHVETFYVYQNLPETTLPVVLVEHNIEYEVYGRFAGNTNLMARPLLKLDIEKIKRDERNYWKKASALVAVSDDEAKRMDRKTYVVPNGVNLDEFKYMEPEDKFKGERRILYIGDYSWIKNKDAVLRIVNDIWPEITKKNKELKLWIVGKNVPDVVRSSPNTMVDDKLDLPTSEIFNNSFLLLAPIKIGGGTSYKILEAMASGVPVLSTKMGTEGLHVKDKVHALLSDDPKELAQMVLDLSDDKVLYSKLTHEARSLVSGNFGWDKIAQKLENVYMEVVK